MRIKIGEVLLRKLEPEDVDSLLGFRNDPLMTSLLGGFSTGYSRQDMLDWVEFHRGRKDEVIWAIAEVKADRCIGHVGFYQIDYRARNADFAIVIGESELWSRGIGKRVTSEVLRYGFDELNLNRIHLTVLETNERAIALYQAMGFKVEGMLREAQYREGKYINLAMMGLLRSDWESTA